MSLKYKTVLTLVCISAACLLTGYKLENGYLFLAGIATALLAFMVTFYADKKDKSVFSILSDGLFWGLFR